jgi:hypothetical protein
MTMPPRRIDDVRISGLESTMREGFQRMESFFNGMDGRLRNVETTVASLKDTHDIRLQGMSDRTHELECEIDAQNKVIDALKAQIDDMKPWIRAVRWLATTFGGLVAVLLWAILTGKITLVQV